MNVSRHVAKDMRSALALVRDVHGPDAVILSNRKVPEGIEITAAVDYDESQFEPAEAAPQKYTFPTLEEADALQGVARKLDEQQTQAAISEIAERSAGANTQHRKDRLAELLEIRKKDLQAQHHTAPAQTTEEPAWFDDELEEAGLRADHTDEERRRTNQPNSALIKTATETTHVQPSAPEASTNNSSRRIVERTDEFDFTVELSAAAREQSPPAASAAPASRTAQPISAEAAPAEADTSQQVQDMLSALPEPETSTPAPVASAARSEPASSEIWTSNSMLDEMRKELSSLRSLVETQISGFAWGDMSRRHPVRAGVLRKLVALGLTPTVARHIAFKLSEDLGHRKAWYRALAMFARQLPVAGDTILTHGGVVALVGPAGVGKTTLIAKLAVQYAARHGRENVALITTDSNRFGAFDQLRNLGSVLRIPVQAVDSAEQLNAALDSFIERPLVLIDTAGLSHRDERLFSTLQTLRESSAMLKAHLVLSATTQADALQQTINAYKPVDPCGCIISKLDESTSMGPVLSAMVEHKLPISYTSEGQRIPDDLKVAQIQDLIGKAVAISKSMNAFEKTEDFMMEQILMGESL